MSIPPEGLNQVPEEAIQKITPEESLKRANLDASIHLQKAASLIDGGGQQAIDLGGRIEELRTAKVELGQASPLVAQAEHAGREIEARWLDGVRQDAFSSLPGVYFAGYDDLQETKTSMTGELARLQSARFGRFRFGRRIQTIQSHLRKLDEYERGYQERVAPHKETARGLTTQLGEIQTRVTEVVTTTAEGAIDETRISIEQIREKRISAIADPNWRTRVTQEYLQSHLDPSLRKAVRAGEIKRRDADEIRAFTAKYFVEGVPPSFPSWGLAKEEAEKIEARRAEYDAAHKQLYDKVGYRLDEFCRGVDLNSSIQPPILLYDEVAEAVTDLVVGGAIDKAGKLLSLFEGERHYGRGSYYELKSKLSALRQEVKYSAKSESRRGYKLEKIQGFDRWGLVARRLIDQGVVTKEEVEEAESQLIWYLTNHVLIPGGHESWLGTAAVSQIADLGNPEGLEGILLYQGLTAGPVGRYAAGHTNNAADYARERMMAKMSDADIEALDSPRFIKRVLFALKHPHQSDLVSNEYREAWEHLDGYSRSRLTAELFGREFKEILEEMKMDPSIDKRWITVALRGVGAVAGEFTESDYSLLSQMAITDGNVRTEILRMLCDRIKGISVALAHHEQVDADLAAQAVLEIINHDEYKPDDEDVIALFRVCNHLGVKLKLPAFPKADRDRAAARAEQIGDKLVGWIEGNNLSERQLLIAIQALDVLEDSRYSPVLHRESSRLLLQGGLEQRYSHEGNQLYGRYGDKIIMLKDWNRHSIYETLADIALRADFILKYRPEGEISIIQAFKQNPDAREGITKVYKDHTNNQEMDTDPARKENYISEYLALLGGPSEYTKFVSDGIEWRVDFLKCQTTTDLVAGAVAGRGEAGRRLLPLISELTTRYRAIEQRGHLEEEKKVFRRKLAESCQGFLTSDNQLDKLYAVMSLATIEWESDEMQQAIKDLYESEENIHDGKKPRELPGFQEVYEQYSVENKDIKTLKKTHQAPSETEPLDERVVSEAISRLFHRTDRGSTITDYALLIKLVDDPRGLPSTVEAILTSLSRFPQAPFFYSELITGSIFEKMDDAAVRQPLLETARRIIAPHFLEASGGGVNVQLDVVRRLINGLKEARQAQRVTPEQTTEIVNIIKSNDGVYRQALRSLNA